MGIFSGKIICIHTPLMPNQNELMYRISNDAVLTIDHLPLLN